MEKEIKKLMQISAIISSILSITALISFLYVLKIYPASNRRIIVYMIVGVSVSLLFIWEVTLELSRANRSGKAKGFSIYALDAGISILLPLYIYLTGLFSGEKDDIRRLYINVNNITVRHNLQKNRPSKILMLLPGCMQNKDCSCNITDDMRNCRRCGGCRIGEAADLVERCAVKAIVVKGGTAARNTAKEFKPDFILAVACERELLSGMADVGRIPVLGVINQRPNGYCTNTTVDMLQLKEILTELEEKGPELRCTKQGLKRDVKVQKNY